MEEGSQALSTLYLGWKRLTFSVQKRAAGLSCDAEAQCCGRFCLQDGISDGHRRKKVNGVGTDSTRECMFASLKNALRPLDTGQFPGAGRVANENT